MIYKAIPESFSPKFEVVSCYLENKGEILLLHRLESKSAPNTWGVPAGKVNPGEKPNQAIVREIFEETSFEIEPKNLNFFQKIYVNHDDNDFVYHMFHTHLENRTEVKINPDEHKDFIWVSPTGALEMNLVPDLDECIKLYYKN